MGSVSGTSTRIPKGNKGRPESRVWLTSAKGEDETRFERVTYRTAAGCSTPELFVLSRGVVEMRVGISSHEGSLALCPTAGMTLAK